MAKKTLLPIKHIRIARSEIKQTGNEGIMIQTTIRKILLNDVLTPKRPLRNTAIYVSSINISLFFT